MNMEIRFKCLFGPRPRLRRDGTKIEFIYIRCHGDISLPMVTFVQCIYSFSLPRVELVILFH